MNFMVYKLITNDEQLSLEINNIKNAKYIALDTEFTRQITFFPKLCTIQICYKDNHAIVIDCLCNINLEPLFKIIYDDNILKIIHGGKQDLEILLHLYGKLPKNIFDTQIAAMLINQPQEISYKALVDNILNIQLDKTQKISDWKKRPLSKQQIEYAAYDVLYLYKIYEKIIQELESENKLDFLENLFDDLICEQNYSVNVHKHLSKIYKNNFSALSYYIAEKLFLWRENQATSLNKPRNHILHICDIKELSLFSNDEALESVMEKILHMFPNKNDNIKHKYALEIFNILQEAYEKKEDDLLIYMPEKNIQLDNNQNVLYIILKQVLENIANKLRINPNIIAIDNDIKQIILYKDLGKTSILSGWRFDLFGNIALQFLNEKKGIYIKDNNLSIK